MDVTTSDSIDEAARRQAAAEAICADVYRRTAAYYVQLAQHLGDQAFGYKILYGPPTIGPPVLFIGFQPAGSSPDAIEGEKQGERIGWPPRNRISGRIV